MARPDAAFDAWWPHVGPWVGETVDPIDVAHEAFCAGWEQARAGVRRDLVDGDPGVLEARFRAILDDEEAAECAGIVAELLDGQEPEQ